jgi:hypothetical protein
MLLHPLDFTCYVVRSPALQRITYVLVGSSIRDCCILYILYIGVSKGQIKSEWIYEILNFFKK